jgi:hypothetical protein
MKKKIENTICDLCGKDIIDIKYEIKYIPYFASCLDRNEKGIIYHDSYSHENLDVCSDCKKAYCKIEETIRDLNTVFLATHSQYSKEKSYLGDTTSIVSGLKNILNEYLKIYHK